jgi:hypothetical protein
LGNPSYNLLQDRLNGGESLQASHEGQQRLSAIQEALGLPPTHQQLREFATRILAAQGDTQPLGKRWINSFLRRNPEIGTVRGKGMDSARLNSATTETIQKFFPLLEIPAIRQYDKRTATT